MVKCHWTEGEVRQVQHKGKKNQQVCSCILSIYLRHHVYDLVYENGNAENVIVKCNNHNSNFICVDR